MKRLLLAGAMFCLAASQALAQQPQAAPRPHIAATAPADPSPVATSAVLSATETWRPIATNLRMGGRLQVAASGQWRVSQPVIYSNDIAAVQALSRATGPDGYTEFQRSDLVMLPSAPIGALVGKIGENGAPFLIGSQYDAQIASDGDLFVTINDVATGLADNAGRLAIEVTVTPPPPPPPPNPDEGQIVDPPPQPRPTLPPDLIRFGLIGAAILAGLLVLSSLFRRRGPRASENERRTPAVPQVTTRIVNDGRAGQSLTLTMRGR